MTDIFLIGIVCTLVGVAIGLGIGYLLMIRETMYYERRIDEIEDRYKNGYVQDIDLIVIGRDE